MAGHADDDRIPAVWPDGIEFVKGLRRYRPAQFSQEIAVTNDRDRISKVHRTWIDDQHKWATPGGLYKVNGWKSDLYKYMPEEPKTWVGNIAVWNGTNFQNNRGWKRSYAPRSLFIDVLSNAKTGKVFETRIAEKRNDGTWDRYVAMKDINARPPGYHGLKMKCATCHNKIDGPGTGGYAVGLVLGSDTIVSDGFPALEN